MQESSWRSCDPLTVSVDTSSIATHSGRIAARVLWDYAETQISSDEAAAPYRSMIGLVVFDCENERFGGAGSVSYSGDGGGGAAVAHYSISPEKAALSSATPGTVGHDLLAFVCARQDRLRSLSAQAPRTESTTARR